MDEQNALVPIDERPAEIIQHGKEIAKTLAAVIMECHLYKVIQDRKYVMVEGWTTLGGIIGVQPREVEVKRLEDGSYEGTVELVRVRDGMVVGGASALCGMDEPTWAKRPEYARRSMAVTRATGKAYRLAYSWIIKLAGYEATPAEEMPIEGEVHEVPQRASASDFWAAVKKAGIDRPTANTILKECGGDFDKAHTIVEMQTPPADTKV
jgi:hypothetical protein